MFKKYQIIMNTRNELDKVRPGLTGIGPIFFRDEEIYLYPKKILIL